MRYIKYGYLTIKECFVLVFEVFPIFLALYLNKLADGIAYFKNTQNHLNSNPQLELQHIPYLKNSVIILKITAVFLVIVSMCALISEIKYIWRLKN